MAYTHRIVKPGRSSKLIAETGESLSIPEGWAFLPSGDAAITRSVKAKGPTWVVQVRKGRRFISKGIWAKEADIQKSCLEVEQKRKTPEYAKRRKADLARRAAKQEKYIEDFCSEVVRFLNFHPRYAEEASVLARNITEHAAPVGSGTVARTERIPIAQRAEAATIAWMRHKTTSYDSMKIARVKGKRREIRRHLAAQSLKVLAVYRRGEECSDHCPLKKLLIQEKISPIKIH